MTFKTPIKKPWINFRASTSIALIEECNGIEYVSSNIELHCLLACSRSLSFIVTAIMKCSKPTVPRHFLITIVALVIAMMQLVIERSQRQSAFVPDKQVFVASMGHRRPWSKIDHMEIHKDQMAGEQAMDQKRGQVEQMLNWMHGEPRPRPDIDIAVVQRMDMLIN